MYMNVTLGNLFLNNESMCIDTLTLITLMLCVLVHMHVCVCFYQCLCAYTIALHSLFFIDLGCV